MQVLKAKEVPRGVEVKKATSPRIWALPGSKQWRTRNMKEDGEGNRKPATSRTDHMMSLLHGVSGGASAPGIDSLFVCARLFCLGGRNLSELCGMYLGNNLRMGGRGCALGKFSVHGAQGLRHGHRKLAKRLPNHLTPSFV